MANISFNGLASGLDTQGIIQQLLSLESRPITILSGKRGELNSQASAFKDLNTRLSALEDAAFALTQPSSVNGKQAVSSQTDDLLATANSNASSGSFQVKVLSLATASLQQTGTEAGQGNDFGGIADLSSFKSETVAQANTNNRLKESLGEGTFFVNGQQILITSNKTIQDIFDEIGTATSGQVTADFVSGPKGVYAELSSASQITLGNGTSNFLSAFQLDTASYNSGTNKTTGTDTVNGVNATVKLDGSAGATNLSQAVGTGALNINGEIIAYNAGNDTLNDVIQRINQSNAGVSAAFSKQGSGQVVLTAKGNGPLAISVSDSGNLSAALGLNASDSSVLGQASAIQVNNGSTQYFNKNTGIEAAGFAGVTLDLKAANNTNISVTINDDTSGAEDNLQKFVDQYNSLNDRIAELTSFDATTNSRGLLISDFTVNNVKDRLNRFVFSQVEGLTSGNPLGSLAEVGISTGPIGSEPGSTSALELDKSKLRSALSSDPNRVLQLFGAEGDTGIFSEIKGYLDGLSNSTGIFAEKQKSLDRQIGDIDDRIDLMNRRLENKQAILEAQFNALELTLSRLQGQQAGLSSLLSNFG